MTPERLSVQDVDLSFGGVVALKAVSFTVVPGTIHAIIGPNGAGKTSCFNVISGIYPPQRGRVMLGNRDLTGLRPHEIARCGVGRAFQNIALSGAQTVRDNLLVGRYAATRAGLLSAGLRLPRARREAREDRKEVDRVAELVGLQHYLDRRAGTLPYGDRKRLELARAFVMKPTVALLDEPVAGMNDEETAQTALVIKQAQKELNMSVLLIEHDMSLVMSLADRVTVLDFGGLLADGTPAEVTSDERVLAAYLGTDVSIPSYHQSEELLR